MGLLHRYHLLLFLLLHAICLLAHQVKSLDEKDLLRGLNSYRASLNLSALADINNANCFAYEVANQLKNQPCSNTTGADTVPGMEPQFSNYPDLLAKCHLNITDTRDGSLMPACVPKLVPDLVLSNYTKTQYSQYLNDSTYTGAGIGSEGDWVVVMLTTNTVGGSFTPAVNAASSVSSTGFPQNLIPLMLAFIILVLLC
ncbi:uncharacterized GPI-anchored protein At3g06035-like [Diospyros lotus]|uniref:uncharacterized GPI-anchored protein At3g06035-like n=1 Tax=Diospyros lotus TaxID=55363 RepID=UPI00224D1655|nr:uncharacterized GPI-anchored protein At3g06035-like [Diospyros lotus]